MKVLIADKFSEAHLGHLKNLGCEITYNPTIKAEDLPKIIAPFNVLVVRSKKVDAAAINASTQLSLILRAGAGVNTIDVKAASARGVFVTNCPGKNSIAVTELVFALLLAIDRRVPDNVAQLRAHKWNKKEFSKADGIYGKTIGIVGVGQIGREVITRAKAFGLHVIAWSRRLTSAQAEEMDIERCENVDDLFRRADIISLHLALKPDTKKFVNAARVALMKPSAILINTARGEIVDQSAIRAALEAKKIRYASDVFDPEPAEAVADFADPLLDLPNFYGTHHIGASTEQAQEAIATEAIRIIETFIKTGIILNCVNLAIRTPARWQLLVRHYDRVGVLASVMDKVRRANINVEEVQNIIFDGAQTASCRIQLASEPAPELLDSIKKGNGDIIALESVKLSE